MALCAALLLLSAAHFSSGVQDSIAPNSSLERIDAVVQEAIARKQLPGAVILIVHRGEVVYRKALGSRSVEPVVTSMTASIWLRLRSPSRRLRR
jgi:CubicO group peptidase (beta-lactamase class C family)